MITFTKEQLIASAHARIEFAEMMLAGELEPLKERTWSIELELARIALASLEAEPGEYLTHVVDDGWGEFSDRMNFSLPVGSKLYAAPPAPVSVPDFPEILPCPVILEPGLRFGKGVPTKAMLGALQRRSEYYAELYAMTPEQRTEHDAGMREFAAMLQSFGNSEQLNSPVIPDGWVACSERMPSIGVPVITCCGDVVQYAAYAWDGKEWQDWYEEYDKLPANTFTHWHPRPAAPQQEVNNG